MGNCLFGGLGPDVDPQARYGGLTKVITSNGGVMEFYAPIAAGSITDEFPGHGIFRTHDLFWKPLPYHEDLVVGESYYLLPFNSLATSSVISTTNNKFGQVVREGHVRSNSIPASSLVTPYRMSMEYRGSLKRSYTDVFSRYGDSSGNIGGRMWKVRLVISPEQLLEILSHEARTEELIESMRALAKCGAGGGSTTGAMSSSSGGFSDQWSLSSSRNASAKTDGFVIDGC